MKTFLENKTLTLFYSGRLDSSNAEEFGKECDEAIKDKVYDSLIMDFNGLEYISSAGLRVILKLAKANSNFKVINASLEVYEIFDITGFASFIKVEKALRTVSIEGAELIGEGFCSKVYRINKDTIVKVMTTTDDLEDITRELNLCKQAFVLGLPTSISFDVVKVDDKYGVVFEMLDCSCLRDWILKDKGSFDRYVELYADLLLKINSTDKGDFAIPSALELEKEHVGVLKGEVSDDDYNDIVNLVNTIPEKRTLIHGDCHIKNILYDGKDISLIDMDTLSYGDPIFELSAICASYVAFEETEPGNVMGFLKLTKEECIDLFMKTARKYFSKISDKDFEENIRKIKLQTYIHMMHWSIRFERTYLKRFEYSYDLYKKFKGDIKDLILKY